MNNRDKASNNESLIHALDECLELMEKGASLEQVLQRYPAMAGMLRPMLEAAEAAVNLVGNIQVPTGAQAHSRAAFLNAAQALKPHKPLMGITKPRSQHTQPKPFIFSLARAALVLLMLIAVGAATAAGASARSLPGDILYPIKLVAEQTQLLFTTAPQEKIKLDQSFNEERLEEIKTLTNTGSHSTKVDFTGKLEPLDGSGWQVGGVRLVITEPEEVEEYIKSGLYLEISGELLSDGSVQVTKLKPRAYEMKGRIESLSTDAWVVSNVVVQLTSNTTIKGSPAIGLEAEVKGYLAADGSLRANEIKIKGQKTGKTPENTKESTQPAEKELEPTRTPKPERTQSETEEPEKTSETEEFHQPDETKTFTEPGKTPEPTTSPESSGND